MDGATEGKIEKSSPTHDEGLSNSDQSKVAYLFRTAPNVEHLATLDCPESVWYLFRIDSSTLA